MSRQQDAPSNASAQGSLQLPLASLANVLASCVLQEAHAGLHSDLQKEGWRGGKQSRLGPGDPTRHPEPERKQGTGSRTLEDKSTQERQGL